MAKVLKGSLDIFQIEDHKDRVVRIVMIQLMNNRNQIPETCISQISGILSYFPVFTPSFWKD